MPTDLPPFIFAEAAVKSKRKDYVSLFDPKADMENLKKCQSDPGIMKAAVAMLKGMGFAVTLVSSCSVRIKASPELFEKTFQVKLSYAFDPGVVPDVNVPVVATTNSPSGQAPPPPTPLIPVFESSEIDALIASVLLDTSTTETESFRNDAANAGDFGPALSEDVIFLDEVVELLGGGEVNMPTGDGIEIGVLEDNLYAIHPYFKPFDLRKGPLPSPPSSSSSSSSASPPSSPVSDSHGTQVVANIFAVAKDAKVEFFPADEDRATAFAKIKTPIVNCSWGTFPFCVHDLDWPKQREKLREKIFEQTDKVEAHKQWQQLMKAVSEYHPDRLDRAVNSWKIYCDDKPRQVIVWSAGNFGTMPPAQAYLNHLNNVIVVGGALPHRHFDFETNKLVSSERVTACQQACGGRRYRLRGGFSILDEFGSSGKRPRAATDQLVATTVAGVLSDGKADVKGFKAGVRVPCVPNAEDAKEFPGKGFWKQSQGTSFSAPQVSAVCAIILEVWPGAEPGDVKKILTETSTPVREGKTWEGFTLWDRYRGVQIGLVHIGRAVKLARFMSLVGSSGWVHTQQKSTAECSADIILKRLRGMPAGTSGDRFAIRGDEPFVFPTHFVDRIAALAKFGITRN